MRHSLALLHADPVGRPCVADVSVRGDVDGADRAALDRLRARLGPAAHVRVDLEELGLCGGALLGWLADLVHDAVTRGTTLHLDRVPRRVARVLALGGMSAAFVVVPGTGASRLRLRHAPKATPRPARAASSPPRDQAWIGASCEARYDPER